ncbi:MAG: LysR family transcriptional regulator, partial [Alphaproteobacteria bacterium]
MDRFKLMETYVAVVGLQSYTRAAKELGVTRAMVSKRVQDLERVLNVKLLNRNTQRLSLTEAGADYYESCISLLAELRAAEDNLLAKRGAARGEIKVLCSKTFGETTLAPIVADFCREYPDITVLIMLKDMGPDENDLISRGFDMSIRTQPVEDTTLVARGLVGLPRVMVAAPDYLARHGTPVLPTDLLAHNCLNPNGARTYDWELEGPSGKVVVRVSGSLRANSSIVTRHAARQGVGIAVLSRYLVTEELRAGELVPVLPDFTVAERMLFVVYPKDLYQPQRMKIFINFFTARIQALNETMQGPVQPPRTIAERKHAI